MMDLFIQFQKAYQLGRKRFKKGDYTMIALAEVKKKTATVYTDNEQVKVNLDELFDAIRVLA